MVKTNINNNQKERPMPRAVHPALQQQNEIHRLAQENQSLATQNQAIAGENTQLKDAMANPNIDTNVGGLAQDTSPRMDPLEAVYDGISQGATMEDLSEMGMLDVAYSQMLADGFTEDDVSRTDAELRALSKAPNTQIPNQPSANKYSLGK